MTLRNRFAVTSIFLILLTTSLYGQTSDGTFGVILYAEGCGFTIFREGDILTFSPDTSDVLGTPLFEGDMIQTEGGTFLELQLLPGRNILKIAENTSFQIRSLGGVQGSSMELIYGRVRAQVDRVAQAPFEIRGRSAVAGVRGTDFGFDYTIPRGNSGEPVTQVYAFAGSVEVTALTRRVGESLSQPLDSSGTQAPPAEQTVEIVESTPVLLGPNQMVQVRDQVVRSDEEILAPEQVPVSPDVQTFWNDNPITIVPLSTDELDTRYPALKIKILESRSEALIEKAQQSLRTGEVTAEEVQAQIDALRLPEPSLADSIPVLSPVGATRILPQRGAQVYVRNSARTLGTIFTGLGAFSAVSSGVVLLWGETFLGIPSDSVNGTSLGLFLGGIGGLVIGLPLYLLNL
ncbi:MAG: FecR domain-containing protein [Spirochaetales bacterium]|nr:FecR domain-containing protein [Spirochaetales bacterium]